MVDFSKLVRKKREVDVRNLLKLFESLDRQASHIELRPAQAQALQELGKLHDERDIILKMSTGSGKTTAALLYLKSHMAEKKQPGVYLCPTKQLVSQVFDETLKLGIDSVIYPAGETYPRPEGMSGNAMIICTYDKLFNAKTTFDRPDVLLRPCAIVLDDAHAGVEEVRDAFTLHIGSVNTLHEKLLKLLKSPCESYKPGIWSSIEQEDPEASMEVPYWSWRPILDEVQKTLSPYSDHDALLFTWPYLRDHRSEERRVGKECRSRWSPEH